MNGLLRAPPVLCVAVHEALRSGLELPAVALAGRRDRAPADALPATLRRVASEAASAGFATLWFADAPAGRRADEVWADPCVLAAACAAAAPLHLGVVAGDGSGRHPSVVARDVTALDHASAGRAVLRLDYPGRAADAAQVCRGLFTQAATTVRGHVFHTDGAVNRPPPVQAGGPPLVAGVEPDEVDAVLAATVDALCVGGDAAVVSQARAAAAGPAVLWAGPLPSDGAEAARRVAALRTAGADGIVCRAADLASLTADTLRAWAAAANGSAP